MTPRKKLSTSASNRTANGSCTRLNFTLGAGGEQSMAQWGDFADALRCLADKAFPTLGEEAKALLALDRYLGELDDTKVAFAVRQGRPKRLEEAVAATLEMESYLSHGQKKEAGVSVVHGQTDGGNDVDTACANRVVPNFFTYC